MIENLDITIWERDFRLQIDYDILDDEEPLQDQIDTLDVFINNPEWLDNAKKQVEAYCKSAVVADNLNTKKDNIFSYIKPDYLFVKYETRKHRVALMCKYRYDEEHGLAIVFDTEGNISVGEQDIIL